MFYILKHRKKIERLMVLQQGETDCGVACLLTILKYHGGTATLEQLRRLSGTHVSGTTMLGLIQAARQCGMLARGCAGSPEALEKLSEPCILHVVISGQFQHYVVFFGSAVQDRKPVFLIGDPATGLRCISARELEQIWIRKACLVLQPGAGFQKAMLAEREKLNWLKQLLIQDLKPLLISTFTGLGVAFLSLVMALFSQHLIDEILPEKSVSLMGLGIVTVFLLLLCRESLVVFRQWILLRQARNLNIRMTDYFYQQLLHCPKSFFSSRKIGELTARLTDTARIQRVVTQLAGNLVNDGLISLACCCFLFSYSGVIGGFALVFLPLFFLLISRHHPAIIAAQRNIMNGYAQSEANYVSTLQGIDPIRHYSKESLFASRNRKIYSAFQESQLQLGKLQIRLSFISNSAGIVFLLAVLGYASLQVIDGSMKTGQLMAILTICSSLLHGIANLALTAIPVHEAKIAIDRMFEIHHGAVTAIAGQQMPDTLQQLDISGLCFRFPGSKRMLSGVSFHVSRGEVIALMGENGCGKTTIAQILLRQYPAESGNFYINGNIPLNSIERLWWRRHTGIVPQHVHLFNTTVLENIAFEDAVAKPADAMELLDGLGFRPFLENLPQGPATLVGEGGINVSGGQRQVIAIARALYQRPELLILDEATAAMDRASESFILQLLRKLQPSMAIIFITHRLHVLRGFCQRIYILENGTITHGGTHEQLLQTQNLYSDYWYDLQIESLSAAR